jgi:hypothetical protein
LGDAISRICAPWESERQARRKRQELIAGTIRWDLPSAATNADRASAAAGARSALAQLPLTSSDTGVRAAVSGAVESAVKAIEGRNAAEREKEKQRADAERAREAQRRAREEREAKARADSMLRQGRKNNLVAEGVAHVSSYRTELFREREITREDWWDSELEREF